MLTMPCLGNWLKKRFWNPDRRMIFTSNRIKAFTTIKGSQSETVEIITNGGTVGGECAKERILKLRATVVADV